MRRKDLEVTDPAEIWQIIAACDCCRLAFAVAGGAPYIVPLNFGIGDGKSLYFHSASEGRKLDLLRQNPVVGFELDADHRLNPSETPCKCSFRFSSVIGAGAVHEVTDPVEKISALHKIMEHYCGEGKYDFPAEIVRATTILKLEITELSCKKHF